MAVLQIPWDDETEKGKGRGEGLSLCQTPSHWVFYIRDPICYTGTINIIREVLRSKKRHKLEIGEKAHDMRDLVIHTSFIWNFR